MARRAGRLAQVLGVLVEHCPSSVALTQSRGESAVAAARRWLRTITDVHASRQESTTQVFDGTAKALHRDKAAYAARQVLLPTSAPHQASPSSSSKHDYRSDPLLGVVADRLLDRLEDCKARSFRHAAIVGGAALQVLDRLAAARVGVEQVTVVDTSPGMLQLIQDLAERAAGSPAGKPWPRVNVALMDPEQEMLPVEPGTVDLVISCLGLHWTNDLPTLIAQCRFALKDDGLFLAALFAGDTLHELRVSCALAQMEGQGGVSPVVSPFAQVRDGGNLLTRAGLALPAVDMDEFVVRYAGGPTELVAHLRSMGEVNGVLQRQRSLRRGTALAAAAIYSSMFGDDGRGGGRDGAGDGAASASPAPAARTAAVPATYQVMFLTGWAPHESQQKPAKRGSATVSFQELAEGLVTSGAAKGGSTGEGGEEQACDVPSPPPPPAAKE